MSDNFYEQLAVWSQIVAALLFIVVLVYLWMRFLAPAVLKSQINKNAELAEAEKSRDHAKERLEVVQRELVAADEDVRAIQARANRDASELRARIVGEAHAEGLRTVKNAEGELDRSRATAREELRAELLHRAMEIARDAAAGLDVETNRRLVAEAVDGAERGRST